MNDKRKKRAGRPLWIAAAFLALFTAALVAVESNLAAETFDGPVERAPFENGRFVNPEIRGQEPGTKEFLRWVSSRKPGPWEKWVEIEPGPAPPQRVDDLRVTFVNHSTVLLQYGGLNILTDPIWSKRTSPVSFIGPKRVHDPGLRWEDLPPIDAVVISHDHYDHLDMPTLKRLQADHRPRFFAGLGNAAVLRRHGLRQVSELDWWDQVPLTHEIKLNFVPAQHFSGRGMFDRHKTLWGGYVLTGPPGVVYFAGDTGWSSHFEQVHARFGPPRLAMLPIGAFQPRWFMHPMHIDPHEAVRAHLLLEAGTSMAIHFGTFRLGDDGRLEPVEVLADALRDQNVNPDRFWALTPGESRDVPAAAPTERLAKL
ncbi:MAG: MBL fold metallo-hydrolase [Candidatus Lernaella stagnicola]|nr:MBL fold metallo-hydrolase [Candidatus Lernaella stagnicola]